MNLRLPFLILACLAGTSGLATAQQQTSDREAENLKPKSQTRSDGKDANKRADANDTWGEWFADLVDMRDDAPSDNSQVNDQKASRTQHSLNRFISRYDANKDGTVSRDELPAGMREGFHQIDRDNNGQLTTEEVRQHAHRQNLLRTPVVVTYVWLLDTNEGRARLKDLQEAYSTLKQIDQDSDGQITRAELKERRQEIASKMIDKCFENHDDNDDGQLTREEARGTVIASRFQKYDENDDGKVGKQEVKETLDQMTREARQEGDSKKESAAR